MSHDEKVSVGDAIDYYRRVRDGRGTTFVEDMLLGAIQDLLTVPDYDETVKAIEVSLHTGFDIEGEDPEFGHVKPSDEMIAWIAQWLAGESFVKAPDRKN